MAKKLLKKGYKGNYHKPNKKQQPNQDTTKSNQVYKKFASEKRFTSEKTAKSSAKDQRDFLSKRFHEQNRAKKNTNSKSRKEIEKEFLTDQQRTQLAKNVKYYSEYTNDQLKELLSKNRQLKTGSRTELLDRCAEGRLFGGLKKCPKCKGGNLNFELTTGGYFCKGFMDEGNKFQNCNYQSCTSERNAWMED